MAFVWDKSLSVGVKLVDEQHQEIFRRVNGLIDAMLQRQGKAEVEKLLGFLATYVVDHFGAEERLMAQYHYPEASVHKRQHADFVKRFQGLKADFDARGPTTELTITVNDFVCAWLREHIGRSDTALGSFLRKASAPEAAAR